MLLMLRVMVAFGVYARLVTDRGFVNEIVTIARFLQHGPFVAKWDNY